MFLFPRNQKFFLSIAFFSIPCFLSAQLEDQNVQITQYNHFADEFSQAVDESNLESIAVFSRFLDYSLEGKTVLDLGCGTGRDLAFLRTKGAKIYGIDASEEMVRLAQMKNLEGEIKIGYCEDIPYPIHSFDVVVSKWAFQTSDDIESIYKEIDRVLKPGGVLVFLSCHPIRQFLEKKRKGKNYFEKQIVESILFDGQVVVREPSHTFNEYFCPAFFDYFTLLAYEEAYDCGSEKVNGDTFPSFFIIKAIHKKS